VVSTVEHALIISTTKPVMAVGAVVEPVLLQTIMRDVTSTSAVLNRTIMKPASSAKNFPVQRSFSSVIVLFGFITYQS
jgi:hypothetical protein